MCGCHEDKILAQQNKRMKIEGLTLDPFHVLTFVGTIITPRNQMVLHTVDAAAAVI